MKKNKSEYTNIIIQMGKNLGTVCYNVKYSSNNETIIFPVQPLDFDYVLQLEIVKKYENQLNTVSINEPKFNSFNDFIHNQINEITKKINIASSVENTDIYRKNKLLLLESELNNIKKFFPLYFQ